MTTEEYLLEEIKILTRGLEHTAKALEAAKIVLEEHDIKIEMLILDIRALDKRIKNA